MKLMKIFQIENDYERHRRRLNLIKSADAKKKVSMGTMRNIEKINNYKSKRSNSTFFKEFESDRLIMSSN